MKRAIERILATTALAASLGSPRAAHAQFVEPAAPPAPEAPGQGALPTPPPPPPPPPSYGLAVLGPADVAPPAPEDPHDLPRRARFALMLRGGPAYRVLYSTPIAAANLDLGIGAETKRGSIYGTLSGLFGSTEFGLSVRQVTLGAVYEYPFGPFRLGAHPRLGYFGVSRVTTDDSFAMMTAGIGGIASIDLWRPSTAAVVLGVEPVIDALVPFFDNESDAAGLFGVNGYLAFRWRDP